MTGKTHQLIALATISSAALVTDPPELGIQGTILIFATTMLGALTPDIDHPTSDLWQSFPAGSFVGRIVRTLFGGHRNMTHSLLGIYVAYRLSAYTLSFLRPDILPTATMAQHAYLVGFLSHLVADTITDRGVPWLWPLKWHIGFPPGPSLFRITTGSAVEQRLLLPGLTIALVILWIRFWPTFRGILGIY